MQKKTFCSFLDTVSLWATILTTIVALLVFIPVAPVWIDGSKVIISSILITLAVTSTGLSMLLRRSIELPQKTLVFGLIAYVATATIATLFVGGGTFSFFGIGIETWTISYILLTSLYVLIVAHHVRDERNRKIMLATLFVSAVVSVVFQLLRISTGDALSFSIFNTVFVNTVGRWFDLGIIAMIVGIVSLLLLVLSDTLSRGKEVMLWFIFAIAGTIFFVISPLVGLFLLAIASFAIVRLFSIGKEKHTHHFITYLWYVLGIVSIIFFVFQSLTSRSPLFYQSPTFPTLAQTRADIVYTDFPNTFLMDSARVAGSVLQESPVFGVGAARFQEAWALYKPRSINETPWWAVDFGFAQGMVLHIVVSFGILGLLGFLTLSFVVFKQVIRSLRESGVTQKAIALIVGLLWLYLLVQTPSAGLLLVICALVGILFSYQKSHTYPLVTSKQLVFGIIIFVSLVSLPMYFVTSRTTALVYAMQAERAMAVSADNILIAEQKITSAISLVPHEVYYQALASLQARVLAQTASRLDETGLSEEERNQLIQSFDVRLSQVERAYTSAITANPKNYVNYFTRAQFLSNLIQPNDPNSPFESVAQADIAQVKTLAPLNPAVHILEAQVALRKNDLPQAEAALLEALRKKESYVDAAVIMSQLNIQQQNYDAALAAAAYALNINVNNAQALYIYGLLQFEAKNYAAASAALERLIAVQGVVSMEVGKVLAESYEQLGNTTAAVNVYQEIAKAYPTDQGIRQVLDRLTQVSTSTPVSLPQ